MENKDPFKAYNTTAYQPGKDDLAAVGSANFATNNFTEDPTPATQTPSQTHVEASQGLSTSQSDSISTLNQKPLESAGNGLRTQNPENVPYASGPQPVQTFSGNLAASGLQNPQKQPNPALQKHKTRAKTITVIAILTTALVLGIGVAVAWLIIDSGSQAANRPSVPSGPTPEAQVEELAVDDELVQKLYQKFQVAKSPWDDKWRFYVDEDVSKGSSDKYLMLTLASAQLASQGKEQICRGDYMMGDEVILKMDCYTGEDMRQEVREMFGQEIAFTTEDVAGNFCGGYHYDIDNDEFHRVGVGCGGFWPSSVIGKISKAEKIGDDIYIYEKALLQEADGVYRIDSDESGLVAGELIGFISDDLTTGSTEEYEENVRQKTDRYLDENSDIYKWTFTKTADGNYVFTSLEKTE